MRVALSFLLFSVILLGTSKLVFATDYVFTGNGAYSEPTNWQGGLIPPGTLNAGSTITINGSAITSSSVVAQDLGQNNGTITISIGGSLILNNGTQFTNAGSVLVNGTLTNNTTWEAFPGSSITISGTYINQFSILNEATITINGGTVNNTGTLDNAFNPTFPGTITIDCGGIINNIAPGILKVGNTTFLNCSSGVSNSGTLSGNSTITGNLVNSGILAPGNSPGLYTVSGNYTATGTATHNFQIAGTTTNLFDRLDVTGTVTLDGAFNGSLISGFTPSGVHDLLVITGNSVTGTFSSVNIPTGYTIVYNSNNVTLHFGTALPVSITQFNASISDKIVLLKWQTSSEQNNIGFYIERSADGNNWKQLSFIQGQGNSSTVHNYSYQDINPIEGINYYRLRQVDVDGNFKYSIIVSATLNAENQFIVYPDPVKSKLYFKSPQSGMLTIFGLSGQRMIKQRLDNSLSINIKILKSGEYIMVLQGNDRKKVSAKFVVQN